MKVKQNLAISASTLVSCLGVGRASHLAYLKEQKTGLRNKTQSFVTKLDAFFGEVGGLDAVSIPQTLKKFDCRNNRLAWLALQTDGFIDALEQLKSKYGSTRIGIALGTSTSGILETEKVLAYKDEHSKFYEDYFYPFTHRMNSLSDFCAASLGIDGPRMTISTACSSSAKVFASAHKWISNDLVDAVLVGGVDSLCLTTIHGFNSLGLISSEITRPLDVNRKGINIGEAGGFMLLEKEADQEGAIKLVGYGETSDAYHISTPHPTGRGAADAMQQALDMAGYKATVIDYINMHGTGTLSNDLSESQALHRVFGADLPKHSSTKGFTGHTLGAAGITEAIICELALKNQFIPTNQNLENLDSELKLCPTTKFDTAQVSTCMSNSFGFGGNNACLIFSL